MCDSTPLGITLVSLGAGDFDYHPLNSPTTTSILGLRLLLFSTPVVLHTMMEEEEEEVEEEGDEEDVLALMV